MAHHTDSSGNTFADTAFLNAVGKITGVSLQHMGFGEFYAETPKGRVDFDRMRGRDFPGQSGRSHKVTGQGAEWLVAQMERGNHSDRVAGTKIADYGRTIRDMDRRLLGMGFRRSQQLLSSGGSEDVHGDWEWGDNSTHIKVETNSSAGDPRGEFWVYFVATQNNRVKERFESKPRTERGFAKATREAMEAAAEWVATFGSVTASGESGTRSAAIRLASALPKGSDERKALLAMLREAQETEAALREARAKEAAANHPLQPGDILYSSWGYDQTNVDYYEVLSISKAMAVIQKIEKRILPGGGRGSDKVVPVPGKMHPRSKPLRKRPRSDGSVTLSSYANAYPWDGKPKHQTSAGYGH